MNVVLARRFPHLLGQLAHWKPPRETTLRDETPEDVGLEVGLVPLVGVGQELGKGQELDPVVEQEAVPRDLEVLPGGARARERAVLCVSDARRKGLVRADRVQ